MIILHRSEPAKHAERWYCLDLTTDLFGNHALYRAWGSLRTTYQHVRCDTFPTVDEALCAAQKIIARRRQHGYREVFNDQVIPASVEGTVPGAKGRVETLAQGR